MREQQFIHPFSGLTVPSGSAVEEVSCHKELESDLGGDGELGDLGGTVGEPNLNIQKG